MATPLFLYWDVTLLSFEVRKFTKLISYQLSNFCELVNSQSPYLWVFAIKLACPKAHELRSLKPLLHSYCSITSLVRALPSLNSLMLSSVVRAMLCMASAVKKA